MAFYIMVAAIGALAVGAVALAEWSKCKRERLSQKRPENAD
jgi:hypothetical protein